MMRRSRNFLLAVLMIGCMAAFVTGCKDKEEGTASVTTAEPQKYVSKDENMVIYLPDDTWSTDEESSDLHIFTSVDGLIMISHTANAGEEMFPEEEQDLKKILDAEGYISEGYEVEEFEKNQISSMKSYKAVIRYTDKKSTYTYGVLYGTILGDDVYLASAMVLSDDKPTLEGIKKAVYGFEWTPDEVVQPEETKAADDEIVTPEVTKEITPEATSEPTPEATPETTPVPTPEATPEPTQEAPQEATPEPAPVSPEDVTALSRDGVCSSPAYVRTGPNTASAILGSLEQGDTVTITGEIRNWYQISYQGSTAYICKDYMQ
ncbi:SH3 domain-containing protein [Ruminococcus sp. OA3]|uniref:SH3 domain-containing protein n=1 Tax=Ruminococcus sp. OA3 TaxID=2914164 RepID=UPI001F06C296|nr:SH3 domain-containing protein [Ruminococcus sp. OA3]MCH1982799.1 SH3 domain-containing protein [Ruminococcus sp. OA3]